jgi:aspartyl-tRNA(Asn)/glutamyl-tRNA(Gln) amidotransferase subunit A
MPTTWGSPALRGYRPAVDELAVARVRAAGAIVLGKTNVPEFTLEGFTSNPLFGTTGNPWNPALTPGGSSGGAAAAVAAGCAPLALGTDGGGSIRRPASHTGLVGLKPSIGSIARDHALPPLLLDLEVVGTLARTVQDTRLLFEAVRGPDAADRRSYAAAAAGAATHGGAGALRVLYVPSLDGAPVDRQIAASCRAAALLLGQGGSVDEGPLPLDTSFMATQWPSIGQIGLAALFAQHPAWRDGASAKYLDMAAQGAALPAAALWALIAALPAAALWALIETIEQLRRDAVQLFSRYDLVVTPSAAALPWPAAQGFPPTIDGQAVGPRGHAVFTGWVNAAGLPALALPAQPSGEGLPIGIQVIGAFGADMQLLQVGAAYEKLAPWAHRWPAM